MAAVNDIAAQCDASDGSIGPVILEICRGGFDFTLFFEQTVLCIAPCSLLLCIFPFRLARLFPAEIIVRRDGVYLAKLIVASSYAALQLACLVLWSLAPGRTTTAAVPSAALSVVSALAVGLLSYYEHTRTIRPSSVLGAFFCFTLLFDAVIARTLWLSQNGKPLPSLFTAGVAAKAILLILETKRKTPLSPIKSPLNSEATSGIYSRSLFWWLNPLFQKGFKKNLVIDDLSPLEDDFSSADLARRMKHAWISKAQNNRRALAIAICSAMKCPLLMPVPARLIFIGFSYSQPFLITAAIRYVQTPATDTNKNGGYGLIGAAALVYLGIAISHGQYNYKLYRAITKIRGCLVGIIYHKTLQLTANSGKASGSLTLMSADVDRIALTAEKAYEIWAGIVEVGIAIYLLERQIGWACIAPLILAVVSTVGNSTIAKLIPSRLKQWNQATQERVAMTSTMLRNVRSIKMMGLTPDIFNTIQDSRTHELERSAHFRWFVAFMNLFGSLPKLLSAPIVFAIFVFSTEFFSGNGLDAARAFTTLSLIELLTTPLGKVLQSIPHITAALGCLDRIQDYLLLDGLVKMTDLPLASSPVPCIHEDLTLKKSGVRISVTDDENKKRAVSAVKFSNALLQYKPDFPEVVKDINLQIRAGSLVMVVGPAGSGKTTLLRAIVGELAPVKGTISLKYSEIAYCQQTPWMINTTVRKNIVCQSADDESWYGVVRTSCELDKDVETLPDGDEVIGSGGISLSGGQKQRIALARAVYARKPIVVLDDVLSALDTNTESRVFESLLAKGGLLRQGETTVIMATNNMHHLRSADKIVALDAKGIITQYNSFNEMEMTQDIEASPEPEVRVSGPKCAATTSPADRQVKKTNASQVPAADKERARRAGDFSCYRIYCQSMGYMRAFLFLVIAMLFAFCSKFSYIWVNWFTDKVSIDRPLFVGVYFMLALSATVLSLMSFWWMMIIIIPISGSNLHKQLLTTVFGAPLSFFTSVDAGVILNRFSQDMNYATSYLPISTMNTVATVIVCIVQFGLISTGSGYLALVLPFLLLAVYFLQKYYLPTSRQLRFLDLEHKSPLYSALTETIEGLPTIRAFGWSKPFEDQFLHRLDDSQRPIYMQYCIQRWLNLVLDLIVAALAVLLMTFATQLRGATSGPMFGVAMVNVLGFGQSLGQFIFYYTDLETSLGAIARIKEYTTEIVPEDRPGEDGSCPIGWPKSGEIKFQNISAAYDANDELVLNDVSLEIPSGQIFGISGRTGSGKSSLALTLLRLLDLQSGAIFIDGIEISTLPRQLIRSKITTVPQDPFFPSTFSIRRNLAGSAASLPDTELIAVLDKVGLLEHVSSQLLSSDKNSPGNATEKDILSLDAAAAILDAKMSSLPLSAGQQQLFCLARALLQDSKIVILDEVTSAMDAATEERLRMVLMEGLKGKTVVMIAHRPTMMGVCDCVVELNGGRVVSLSKREISRGS